MPSTAVIDSGGWSSVYTGYGYYFDKFTCSNTNCCTQTDLVYQLATTNTNPPTLVASNLYTLTWSAAHSQMELVILDRATLDTTGDYYIFVTNSGSNNIKMPYQYAFSPMIRWTIVCGPKSVTITEGAYPTTPVAFVDEQDVQMSSDGSSHIKTQWVLPTYSITGGINCPVTGYEVVTEVSTGNY